LPAALVRLADPTRKPSGVIDADLSIRGPLGDPAMRLTVSAPAIKANDPAFADLPPLKAEAEVLIDKRRLTVSVDAAIGAGATGTLRASARLLPGEAGA